MSRLTDMIIAARQENAPLDLREVGLAVPAVLDLDTGTIELLTNFTPEWTGYRLKDALQQRTGMPVFIQNDVRAATVGEQTWGAGRGYRDFVCIAIGTGIGGGLVLDGRLYMGSRGAAGEIGHQTIDPAGPRCNCGNFGCLEALASGTAIARAARSAIEAGDAELARLAGSEHPTSLHVARAAEAGSASALAIWNRTGEIIGLALANLICVLNPAAIVVGGGVAKAGDLLMEPIRREVERRTIVFRSERGGVVVEQSPLGGLAGAMGAAAWAMRHSRREIAL